MTTTIDTILRPARPPSHQQIARAVDSIAAVAEAVRTAGEIPSGHLYAMMCGVLSLADYQSVVAILGRAGVVEETGHLLRWCGPVLP